MLTETVIIEDRVLRFEKAKSGNNYEFSSNFEESELVPGEYMIFNNALSSASASSSSYYPQVYLPLYSYGMTPQQIHPFQVQHQPLTFYPHPQVYPSPISTSNTPDSMQSFSSDLPFDDMNKIFVGHLNGESVTQRKLLRHFQHYGHITDIELFKNNLDGSLRQDAFAFISYLKSEQMHQAIKEENGREWLGKQLKCCKALKKREASPNPPIEESSENANAQICLPL